MVKTKKNKQTSSFINYYETEACKPFLKQYNNPSFKFDSMPLKHPMRGVLVGASGSGKSNVLCGLIEALNNTFNYIKIFTQDKSEPLYEMLESLIEKPYLEIFEGIDAFNKFDLDSLEDDTQNLFIFDDMCIEPEKKQAKICEMYIRGRKIAGLGISCLYITQSYYDTPNVIRKQANQLFLKKINGKLETNAILRDCTTLDMDRLQLQNMYKYCVDSSEDICNFLFIDKSAPEKARFRKNLDEVLNIEYF